MSWGVIVCLYFYRSRKIQIRNIPPHLQWEVSQCHFRIYHLPALFPHLNFLMIKRTFSPPFTFRNRQFSDFSHKVSGSCFLSFQYPNAHNLSCTWGHICHFHHARWALWALMSTFTATKQMNCETKCVAGLWLLYHEFVKDFYLSKLWF